MGSGWRRNIYYRNVSRWNHMDYSIGGRWKWYIQLFWASSCVEWKLVGSYWYR
jgi:hypothetical protein